MNISTKLILLCMALLVAAAPAGASLIGDEVLATLHFGDDPANSFDPSLGPNPVSGIVGAGNEFLADFPNADYIVDIGESSVWVFLVNQGAGVIGAPLHLWLEDLDWVDQPGFIVDVVLAGTTNVQTLTWDWTGDSIHITMGDQSLQPGEILEAHFDIIAVHDDIPEPATMTLLGLGLAGLAYRRRKRA